ncbi:MAG: response regulator [Deltaproteobacteria bacterium]|nr:response regulator [Deltaproteobacteria bacterium]
MEMNYFLFLPFVSVLINVFAWSYIYAQKHYTAVNRTCLIFLASLLGWVFCDFLAWMPTPSTWKVPLFRIACIFWIPSGFLFLNFIYAFLGKEKDLFYKIMLTACAVTIFLSLITNLTIFGHEKTYWGEMVVPGIVFVPIILFLVTPSTLYAYYLTFKRALRTEDVNQRRQLMLLLLGVTISLSIGLICDVIFPAVLKVRDFIRLGSSGCGAISLCAFLAVVKYNFLSVGVEKAATNLFENILDGIILIDPNGNITNINESARAMFYLADSELRGLSISDLLKNHDPTETYQNREITIMRKGKQRVLSVSQSIIEAYEVQLGKLIIIRDFTEIRKAEEEKKELQHQLQKAQKMEVVGVLAGGVAHDLNNILSGLINYPELILLHLPEDSPLQKPVKSIQASGLRAAEVVEDLLSIARGVATNKEISNLNMIVEEYLTSSEHQQIKQTHPALRFKKELDPDLLNVNCSGIHVTKALINLVINASESRNSSLGTVTIATRNCYLDKPLKGYDQVRTGEYAVLSVSDDGPGIDPMDLERIFEPFYTKKKMGRSGSGLGLAVVWNTIQDHQGYKDVRSDENGTVFELYFPAERTALDSQKKAVSLKEYTGHGESILVVDDEEQQRDIAFRLLTELNYKAATAASGRAAIEYVRRKPFDLILLDMVMPDGMNGRETYEEIIKIHPGQKAIIASGYARTKEVMAAQALGAGKYLKKPYVLERLGMAIREELQR